MVFPGPWLGTPLQVARGWFDGGDHESQQKSAVAERMNMRYLVWLNRFATHTPAQGWRPQKVYTSNVMATNLIIKLIKLLIRLLIRLVKLIIRLVIRLIIR